MLKRNQTPENAVLVAPIERASLRPSRALELSVVTGLLVIFAALLGASLRDESPMTDEPFHLTRGLAYFWGPDTSLSWAHPPLGNAIAALPIALTADRVDMAALPGYGDADFSEVATELLLPEYATRRNWFLEGRAMVALLSVLLAFYVYQLSTRLFGGTVGRFALGFFVLFPTLVAHGRTLTTDMPVTVAMTAAVGELTVFLTGGAWRHGIFAALALSAALITKFTGLMLVPFTVLLVIGAAAMRAGRYRGLPLRKSLSAAMVLLVLFAVCGAFSINAIYRFERTGLSVTKILEQSEPMLGGVRKSGGRLLEKKSPLARLPGWLPVPLPYTYLYGLVFVGEHNEGGHSSWFLGESSRRGNPFYFPVMILIKTPIALLAALACALVAALRKRARLKLATFILVAYAGCYLLIAMRANLNIGIRHILPILPILAMVGGLGATYAWNTLGAWRYRKALFALAACGSLVGVAYSYPDYISDFNVLVGGRAGGQTISIIGEEWGQDSQRLARALRARDVTTVYMTGASRMTRAELALNGVATATMKCDGSVPLGAHYVVRARDRVRRECALWSHERKPLFDINGHLFVYRLE